MELMKTEGGEAKKGYPQAAVSVEKYRNRKWRIVTSSSSLIREDFTKLTLILPYCFQAALSPFRPSFSKYTNNKGAQFDWLIIHAYLITIRYFVFKNE